MKAKNNAKPLKNSIASILLNEHYITAEDMKAAQAFADSQRGSMVDYLINEQLISRDLLGQAIAEHYKIPYANLHLHQPKHHQVRKIPKELAEKYSLVLFKADKDSVTIATDRPRQKNLIRLLQDLFQDKEIKIAYAQSNDIQDAFVHYRQKLETRFSKILKDKQHFAPELVEEILADALAYKCSDIHFEPQGKSICIRFRIDGVLHEAGRIPKQFYDNIINRIKVLAHLRIDEHASAQDGSFRFKHKKQSIDLRVSIVPTIDGEKIVIRLLSEYVRGLSLEDIGLSGSHQEILTSSAQKPFGMILVVGPTGSGKTSTIYGILKFLNKPEVNISTIEDPVEYKIAGITHIQVNPETNLTFAKGLKSIVRQDPDIILVGEIRDHETAEIAVNAALTGQLLLSTFHANNAASSIPRLIDMGVEPFILSSTLELIIAQRLIRRICLQCRHSHNQNPSKLPKKFNTAKEFLPEESITLYKGKGCNACQKTGYKGRIAIFEFIKLTNQMRDLIVKSPSSQEIWELAIKQGSKSMFEDGIEKVKNGISTLEEVFRSSDPS